MIYLLDVSLLIALVDQNHVHHLAAISWIRSIGQSPWATCPITENGMLRILSSPSYPVDFNGPDKVFSLLRRLRSHKNHRFWADDFSLLDVATDPGGLAVSSRNITDIYLLALAIRHRGRFVTFDQRIPATQVMEGGTALLVLEP